MARERTTIDVYEVHGNYGQGFEFLTAEFTRFYARKQLRLYQENSPEGTYKIVKKREPKADYSPKQLADIQQQIERSGKEWWNGRKAAYIKQRAAAATTAEQARDVAIEWQHWQADVSMSYAETGDWQDVFEKLTKRFPELRDEFRENAIVGDAPEA